MAIYRISSSVTSVWIEAHMRCRASRNFCTSAANLSNFARTYLAEHTPYVSLYAPSVANDLKSSNNRSWERAEVCFIHIGRSSNEDIHACTRFPTSTSLHAYPFLSCARQALKKGCEVEGQGKKAVVGNVVQECAGRELKKRMTYYVGCSRTAGLNSEKVVQRLLMARMIRWRMLDMGQRFPASLHVTGHINEQKSTKLRSVSSELRCKLLCFHWPACGNYQQQKIEMVLGTAANQKICFHL